MIHATAIIEPGAQIASTVIVGPYCHIGPEVILKDNVQIVSHVVITGRVTIEEGTKIFPFTVIGHAPQSTSYKNEPSEIQIGRYNLIREHVTIHPGTAGDNMITKIGDHCMIMVNCHIAHDCIVGNHIIMANNATLGGHVVVEDYAYLGGLCGIHQKVRLGMGCVIGGLTGVNNDVIPFGSVIGHRARLSGLNLLGLKRRGIPRDSINKLRKAYRLLFANEGTLEERIEDVKTIFPDEAIINQVIDFMQSLRHRSLCLPTDANAIMDL